MNEPPWWYVPGRTWQSVTLSPAAAIYAYFAGNRLAKRPSHHSKLPVLCVGNFTAGGTGKTPLSIALAELVRSLDRDPVFLTRGYGGRLAGPVLVDIDSATAYDVGDEPLLLARTAMTMIARDRAAGARAIEAQCPANSVIIMDDGLQNPALAKDLTIAVVDIHRRFGNGQCLPAGPLRGPLTAQMPKAAALIVTGEADASTASTAADELGMLFDGPILRAQVRPAGDMKWLLGAKVIAFAGIANPDRFFALLQNQGAQIVSARAFPDHHAFTDADAKALIEAANSASAQLVTTEKDIVRLHGATGPRRELRDRTHPVPVVTTFRDQDHTLLRDLLTRALNRPRDP